jgi:hypothetical protein
MKKFQIITLTVFLSIVILTFTMPVNNVRAQDHRSVGIDNLALSATPTATPDFINTPVVPENPSQVDLGRDSFWYNCMPCHGDHGQGLTDAWRETWPDDHQQCWNRGCHGGRLEDEGFPIPRTIPPVFDLNYMQKRFPTESALFEYLSTKHPPQNPGCLEEDDYWALTAYMLFETKQVSEEVILGPVNREPSGDGFDENVVVFLGLLVCIFSGLWIWTKARTQET